MGQLRQDPQSITRQAIDVYLASKETDGLIKGLGYWQAANGYTAIALHDLWSGSSHYKYTVEAALSSIEASHPNFINEFNDDTLWWALASIAAYRAYGHDPAHLKRAVNIYRHVTQYIVKRNDYKVHGMDMEGGVFWTTKPDEQSVNAITTGLFAELSAELAVLEADEGAHSFPQDAQFPLQSSPATDACLPRESRESYLSTAWRSLAWIKRCRLSDFIVRDTIKVRDKELIDWIFTYNTGQCIGACTSIARLLTENSSDREEVLHFACRLAEAAMAYPDWHEGDGALTEPGAYGPLNHQAHENDDAVGFKSVLVRNLAKLYKELTRLPSTKGSDSLLDASLCIRNYLIFQFNTLQMKDVNEFSQYGPWWAGPLDLPTSHSQMAILDVVAAIHLFKGACG